MFAAAPVVTTAHGESPPGGLAPQRDRPHPGLVGHNDDRSARPAARNVLALGVGTGRLSPALRDLGLAVTAVDESAEMLTHVGPGMTVVRSSIETLLLEVRYDLALLASYLVNTDNDELRCGLLDACRRHVADTGTVVVQRHPPSWFDQLAATAGPTSLRVG